MNNPTISPELLRKLLRCVPETGKLFWKSRTSDLFAPGNRTAESNCRVWNKLYEGKEALTSYSSEGYLHGTLLGKRVYSHRLIWAIENGEFPACDIDHINGVRDDNRIENLRSVSRLENTRNAKAPKGNVSGVVGVRWVSASGKWMASIGLMGKTKYLGAFANKSDAIDARKAAEIRHGFHPNHGRAS